MSWRYRKRQSPPNRTSPFLNLVPSADDIQFLARKIVAPRGRRPEPRLEIVKVISAGAHIVVKRRDGKAVLPPQSIIVDATVTVAVVAAYPADKAVGVHALGMCLLDTLAHAPRHPSESIRIRFFIPAIVMQQKFQRSVEVKMIPEIHLMQSTSSRLCDCSKAGKGLRRTI